MCSAFVLWEEFIMMLSYILDFFLGLIGATMLCKGAYGITRQLALAPLVIAALDASFASVITYTLTPIISCLLTLLQLTVLVSSAMLLYQDRVRARNKQERRRRRREILRTREMFDRARDNHDLDRRRVCA